MSIRVLIAEDQYLVLDALSQLLDREEEIEVVAKARNGKEAVLAALSSRPDVALLDIDMPELDGIEACRQIKVSCPETAVAMLTTFARPGYLQRALDAGASGFLLKDDPVGILAQNIKKLRRGEKVLNPALAVDMLVKGPCPLTERELDVLRAAADGSTVGRIAELLFLSEGTVRNYLSVAIQKLDVENRAQAIRKAQDRGWV